MHEVGEWLRNPYLQSFLQGFLYWCGNNLVGPTLIALVSVLFGQERLKRADAENFVDEAGREVEEVGRELVRAERQPSQVSSVLFSDRHRDFAQRAFTFHKHLATKLQSRSAPRLNTGRPTHLEQLRTELAELSSHLPADTPEQARDAFGYYKVQVERLLANLTGKKRKTPKNYLDMGRANEAMAALLELVLGEDAGDSAAVARRQDIKTLSFGWLSFLFPGRQPVQGY